MNAFVMDTFIEYFNVEISNKVTKLGDKLIVYFADGKKAKIKFISLM